jgi:hypothetical protein
MTTTTTVDDVLPEWRPRRSGVKDARLETMQTCTDQETN